MSPREKVLATVTAVCAVFCFAFPLLTRFVFDRIFADYYGLPALTELALTVWFPLMVGLNPAAVAFYALNAKDAPKRRLFLHVACAMGVAAALLLVGAMVLAGRPFDAG